MKTGEAAKTDPKLIEAAKLMREMAKARDARVFGVVLRVREDGRCDLEGHTAEGYVRWHDRFDVHPDVLREKEEVKR